MPRFEEDNRIVNGTSLSSLHDPHLRPSTSLHGPHKKQFTAREGHRRKGVGVLGPRFDRWAARLLNSCLAVWNINRYRMKHSISTAIKVLFVQWHINSGDSRSEAVQGSSHARRHQSSALQPSDPNFNVDHLRMPGPGTSTRVITR